MHQFTVTEARTAILCPRVFYFDDFRFRTTKPRNKRVTLIWAGPSSTVSGCGQLFHQTIERFNSQAATSPEINDALSTVKLNLQVENQVEYLYREFRVWLNKKCLNRKLLNSKKPPEQQGFIRAIDQYVRELAQVVLNSLHEDRSADVILNELFGDHRKRVDVTFYVGENDTPVRIKGILDYIYFDSRLNCHRLLDFKLQPPDSISKDLLQTSLYALMHNQQHGTAPNAAVMYLHPERKVVEHSWTETNANRAKVYNLLASMSAWSDYNEQESTGLKPPGEASYCSRCPWSRGDQCRNRLGSTEEGERIDRFTAKPKLLQDSLVRLAAHIPPESAGEIEVQEWIDDESINGTPRNGTRQNSNGIDEASTTSIDQLERSATKSIPISSGEIPKLYLGKTIGSGQPLTVPLADLKTHVSVVGAAGSGKSWLAKVLVEEAIRNNVPVLAIDPQGDLVQFLQPAKDNSKTSTTEFDEMRNSFRSKVEVRIWTPGSSHGQRLCLSPLKLPRMNEVRGTESIHRQQEEWEAMLGVAAGNLVALAQAPGSTEEQKAFLMQLLRLICKRSSKDTFTFDDIIGGIANPSEFGLDEPDRFLSKRDRTRLVQRLNARQCGPTSNLFSGGVSLDLDRFINPVQLGKVPLNIVYLNALADDEQKQFFVASLAAEIYRWMITSNATGDIRLLVFLDEAKDFIPAGSRKPPAKEPLIRLFSQGRKFGVGALICTQSPRSVDYQVFSNASTKFIGRLEASQDVERVSEWFRGNEGTPPWLAGRKGATPGKLIGRWPSILPDQEGLEFISRPLFSLHEGAWSPERVEAEWASSEIAPVLGKILSQK